MKRKIQSKIQYDKKGSRPLKDLAVDDRVYVKPRQKRIPWIYGKFVERPDERSPPCYANAIRISSPKSEAYQKD